MAIKIIEIDENVLVLYNVLNDMYFKNKYPKEIEKSVLSLLNLLASYLGKDKIYEGYDIIDTKLYRNILLKNIN